MVAQGMKEPIRIRGDSAGAVHDRLAQAPGWIDSRQLQHEAAVDIYVCRRVVFEDIGPRCLYVDRSLPAGQGHCGLELNGYTIPNLHVFDEIGKAGRCHFHVVWVCGDIIQPEVAI